MSISPRVIYSCDHVIVDRVREYGDIEMTRNETVGFPDKLYPNISMIRVDEILNKDKTIQYSKNVDFQQKTSPDIIEWVGVSGIPDRGEKYFVRGAYIKTIIRKETIESCDRCYGNGWYADIFNSENNLTVTGEEKLMQDFVKVLFTEKQADGYGSTIRDILSENIYNEVDLGLEISNIIKDCEDQIKSAQRSNINNGIPLPLEETLSEINVKKVIFVREENTCYISIAVINGTGNSTQFTFKI